MLIRDLVREEEWAFFEPFVVESGPKRGRPSKDHRRVLDGVFWIARTGAPWRDLPEIFGNWASVCRQFRRWTLDAGRGLGAHPRGLNEADGSRDSFQMSDSTIARAAGARRDPRPGSWPFESWPVDQGPPPHQRRDDRLFLEALHFFAAHDLTWRALPNRFGKWNRIRRGFDPLSRAGVFEDSVATLAGLSGTAHLVQMFASTIVRTHVSVRRKGAAAHIGARPLARRVRHRDPSEEDFDGTLKRFKRMALRCDNNRRSFG